MFVFLNTIGCVSLVSIFLENKTKMTLTLYLSSELKLDYFCRTRD